MVSLSKRSPNVSWLLYTTVSFILLLVLYINSKGSSPNLIAVVIETDPPPNLPPIALHFATVLGPKWKIRIYTLEQNWVVPSSVPFQRAMESGSIEIRFLPPQTDISDGVKVSEFMADTWLWEQLQDAAHVLMFQLDSILCANSEQRVEDFLHYDYIGAPINPGLGRGFNGGLSLRNPRLFLQIARDETLEKWEDQWFYAMAERRVDQGVRLPTIDEAKLFSVETIYYERPLGYHQAPRWQPDHLDAIMEWCPEVGMAGQKRTRIHWEG